MKNWKVILWLFVFYPIGIYNMFKYTSWHKGIKYTITAILGLTTLQMIFSGELPLMLTFSGLIVFLIGIVSVITNSIKKKNKKVSIMMLVVGILLITLSYPQFEKQQELVEKQEQQEKQLALVKGATIAVEAAEKEKNRAYYKKAYELVGNLKPKDPSLSKRLIVVDTFLVKEENIEEATVAIEKAEKDKTEENYDTAASLIAAMDIEGTDLEQRLANVKEFVDLEKVKTEEAVAALEEAEESNKRESYDKASVLISELTAPDEKLIARLSEADTVITIEEEKIATEKAEQDKITAKKAEDARIASEKEKQNKIATEKTETTKVAEKKEQQPTGGNNESTAPVAAAPSTPAGGDVSSIDTNGNGKVTIPEAEAAGYPMPITSDHWLYQYMDDRNHNGMVGE